MSGPWIMAFVALAVVQFATLAVVIGVLRQVLPALGDASHRAGDGHAHGAGLPATRPVGPAAGAPLPALPARAASTEDGREVTGGDLGDGSVVLLFLDEDCAPCRQLAAALGHGELRLGATRLYQVVDDGADWTSLSADPGIQVVRQRDRAVAAALGMDATPSAVTVRDGVVVDSCVVTSPSHLQGLIDQVAWTGSSVPRPGRPSPSPSPSGSAG